MKRVLLFALLVAAVFAALPAPPSASAATFSPASQVGTGYWCPPYSRYCSTNKQCAGYCGPGVPPSWEICQNGCCACLG